MSSIFNKKKEDGDMQTFNGRPPSASSNLPNHNPATSSFAPRTSSMQSPLPQQSQQQNPMSTNIAPNNSTQSQPTSQNGFLLIRLIEARNVPIPNPADKLPYCVVEFDKNELLVPAKEIGLGAPGSLRSINWSYRAHFDVSRPTEISLNFYYPSSNTAVPDTIIGALKIRPTFLDQQIQDEWFSLQSPQNDSNNSLATTSNLPTCDVHLQICYKKQSKKKPLSIDDFELLKVLGKGSFGKVMQVRKRDTNRIYAMKIIRKAHIIERDEVEHTLAERAVLAKLNHAFIVPLKFSFQSPEKLYLALAFVNGGELFHHLQREGRFSEDRARFYVAELLCAIECLHSYNIIYRDLKPENILLDYNGHIQLCDFGLCKLNMKEKDKTNTFCGTPEYLAPEVLLGQGYSKVVDWWTLGILLYEMLTGLPPFYDENVNEMYKKIITMELQFPEDMNPNAQNLLRLLLERDPARRFGANGAEEIRKHPFFADINWTKLLNKKYQPPFKPMVASATDTSNFDQEFTSEVPLDSVAEDSHLSETIQQQFMGFTYQGHEMIGSVAAGSSLMTGSRMSHK